MEIIRERLAHYDEKLRVLEAAMEEELRKEYGNRNYELLNFLAKERDTFRFVRKEVTRISEAINQVGG